jgi:hypothetical protein
MGLLPDRVYLRATVAGMLPRHCAIVRTNPDAPQHL